MKKGYLPLLSYGRKIQFCSNFGAVFPGFYPKPCTGLFPPDTGLFSREWLSPGVWVIEQNLEEPEQIFCQ